MVGMCPLTIFALLLTQCLGITDVSSVASPKKYSRTILESSNTPNLSVSPLLLLSDMKEDEANETNATWKAKGFSTKSIPILLSECSSFRLPAPSSKISKSAKSVPGNSSRLFHSTNETATLTITVKQFRHALMYLNFSYYVGSIPGKSAGANSTEKSKSSTTSTVLPTGKNTAYQSSDIKPLTPLPTTKTTTVPPTFIDDDTSEESEDDDVSPEPIPIMHDMARRKRSVFNKTESTPNASASVIATTIAHLEISLNQNQDDTISSETTPIALKPEAKAEQSKALDQAFEIIKTVAAAAITKGSPRKSTGHMDPSANQVPTKSNGAPETPTVNPITEANDISKLHSRNEKSSKQTTTESTAERDNRHDHHDDHRHHHRHKSRTGGGAPSNNAKSGSNKSKGKKGNGKNGKKDDIVERIPGKTNDEEEEPEDSSSSSSSSSEESYEHEEENKKISYKTWKASFEKKNRPPGLYVMVNDDIIFDNWEGLWDKHYVLGRWTGTNPKPLAEGMWNHTQLFMNWEDVPINDVKITFEWEPMNENSYLVLSDIVVSTIETTSCKPPSPTSGDLPMDIKGSVGENTSALDKVSLSQSRSIVIIKQGEESSGAWKIIKMGKAGSAEVDSVNYKELNKKRVDNLTQAKLIGEDGNDDLLKAVLQTLQGINPSSTIRKEESGAYSTASSSGTSLSTTTSMTSPKVPSQATTQLVSTTTTSSTTPPTTSTTTTPSPSTASPSTSTSTPSTTSTASTTSTTSTSTQQTSIQVNSQVTVAATPAPINDTEHKRQRNEDRESALLVSVVTGGIAMAILILTLKKYYEISKKEKQRNPQA